MDSHWWRNALSTLGESSNIEHKSCFGHAWSISSFQNVGNDVQMFLHGVENILQCISFLTWYTETDVATFQKEYKKKLDKSFVDDKESIGPRTSFNRRMIRNSFRSCAVKRGYQKKGKSMSVLSVFYAKWAAQNHPLV